MPLPIEATPSARPENLPASARTRGPKARDASDRANASHGVENGLGNEIAKLRSRLDALAAERADAERVLADLAARCNSLAIAAKIDADQDAAAELIALGADEVAHERLLKELIAVLHAGRQRLADLERQQEAHALRRKAADAEALIGEAEVVAGQIDNALKNLAELLANFESIVMQATRTSGATSRAGRRILEPSDLFDGLMTFRLGDARAAHMGIRRPITAAGRTARSFLDVVAGPMSAVHRTIGVLLSQADGLTKGKPGA
jgi:hypothetical protein